MGMAEHCTQCDGTGKKNRKACLYCAGTGIEPGTKPTFTPRYFGPLHTYPALKRDIMITVGLVILLLIVGSMGG